MRVPFASLAWSGCGEEGSEGVEDKFRGFRVKVLFDWQLAVAETYTHRLSSHPRRIR